MAQQFRKQQWQSGWHRPLPLLPAVLTSQTRFSCSKRLWVNYQNQYGVGLLFSESNSQRSCPNTLSKVLDCRLNKKATNLHHIHPYPHHCDTSLKSVLSFHKQFFLDQLKVCICKMHLHLFEIFLHAFWRDVLKLLCDLEVYRCANKKKSAPQNLAAKASLGWPLFPGTGQGSQGPDFHSQQQNSLVNTNAGKHGLKSASQSSVILELLMWKIILYYRKNPQRLPHTHSSLRAATRRLFKLSMLTLIAAAPCTELLQEGK